MRSNKVDDQATLPNKKIRRSKRKCYGCNEKDHEIASCPSMKEKAWHHHERGSLARKQARGKKRRHPTRTSNAFAMLAEEGDIRLVSVPTNTTSHQRQPKYK
jgi:hypothetical protein